MISQQAHRLIKIGDLIALRRALDEGLDPNILLNRAGWTLLMQAALKGNTSIGSLLISRGANLDHAGRSGDTALSFAAQTGHLWMMRFRFPPHKITAMLDLINSHSGTRSELG
jgi:ankyrin repeat protein